MTYQVIKHVVNDSGFVSKVVGTKPSHGAALNLVTHHNGIIERSNVSQCFDADGFVLSYSVRPSM